MAHENMSLTPGDIEMCKDIFDELGLEHSLIRWGLSSSEDRWCLYRADTDEMLRCRIYPSLDWVEPE